MTDDFANVIDDLASGRIITTTLDDGTKVKVWHDPLLAQLRAAVAANLTGGNGTVASAHRIPLNADALELYEQLETVISEAYVNEHLGVPGLLPEDNLKQLWVNRWLPYQEANDLDVLATEDAVRGWRAQINNLFDPPKKIPLDLACPVCRQTHWINENGDQNRALVMTYRADNPTRTVRVTCHATREDGAPCATVWDGYDAAKELGEELATALASESTVTEEGH